MSFLVQRSWVIEPPVWMLTVKDLTSRARLLDVDEWKHCPKNIFFPVGPRKRVWDMLILLAVLYSIVMVPYQLAFDHGDVDLTQDAIEWSVQFLLILDLFTSFNTAFLNEKYSVWIVDRPAIARKYLTSWFLVDAIACIPFVEMWDLLTHHLEDLHEINAEWLLRSLRLFRLRRLIPELINETLQWPQLVRQAEDALGMNLKGLGVINTMIGMLAFVHVIACICASDAIDSC